jgi:uncharacterized protein YbjT (DUF2867 family)
MTLLLVGATGLVGQTVLEHALRDSRVSRVVAPTRRRLAAAPDLENPIVEFDRLPADAGWWAVDAVVCALGSTIGAAGSRAAFRRVDHDYVVSVARLARAHGARAFALISAIGADPASGIFYNRVKGDTETSVAACGFPSLTIVRPGFIGGRRRESRPAEFAAVQIVGLLGPLLPRRWRINPAENIARALLNAAVVAEPGRHVITSADLVGAVRRSR